MKKNVLFVLFAFVIVFFPLFVFAEKTTMCNIGTTNGVTYSNEWQFSIYKEDSKISWAFKYIVYEMCSPGNCKNYSLRLQEGVGLNELFSHPNFENLSSNTTNGYNNGKLEELLKNNTCPEYIYVANNLKSQKIGFIFSSTPVTNSTEIFKNKGYIVNYYQEGENLTDIKKKNYEDYVEKMKKIIEEFENEGYGDTFSSECYDESKFGFMDSGQNLIINTYERYKEELNEADPNYDFTSGEKVYNEYKNKKCYYYGLVESPELELEIKPETCQSLLGNPKTEGTPSFYISFVFKILRYIAIIILIVLTVMDFVGAVASQDNDIIKKATSKAITRAIMCVGIFLLPTIIEFVLQFIHNTSITDCVDLSV